MTRALLATVAVVASLGLGACSGRGQSDSQASPEPSVSASGGASTGVAATASAEAAAEASAEASAGAISGAPAASPAASVTPLGGDTPIPAPTPTPNPNLLSVYNGTILRAYSPATLDDMNDGNLRDAAYGIGSELSAAAKPPFVFTFELPTVATISEFQANLRNPPDKGPPASVTFAVSTTGAESGFKDVGSIVTGDVKTLSANVQARWVRVTANQLYDSIGATGTFAKTSTPVDPEGVYVENDDPDKNGSFVPTGTKEGYERVRIVRVGSSLVGTECAGNDIRATWIGELDGRSWNATQAGNKDANPDAVRAVVNDEGTVIAGRIPAGGSHYFTRTTEQPAACFPRTSGTGTHKVLVLDLDPTGDFYPVGVQPPLPNYTISTIGAGMLDADVLKGVETVISRDVCKMSTLTSAEQRALLLQWVAAGHKLIIAGGSCVGGSDFTWLPFPFVSAGPGPESTNPGLVQIENDALGTNDKNDAGHFVDAKAYATNPNNSMSLASVVTTTDPHWCGHEFVAKTTNLNGFVQMYAVDGGGSLIYDGFFGDDGNAVLQRIRQLELALPVPANLPCTQHVTDSFILEPDSETTFEAGKTQTVRVPLEILANQGWSGPVKVTSSGDLHATVTPNGFNLAGGTLGITAAIAIPASTKAGVYTVNVVADNGGGNRAGASITLTGTAPLRKQFAPAQKRIRIYGIHFDVDSAVIQARSEPVIAEIASILRTTPALRFQVEGHTDSDGGAAYNLGLSQRRAQAVVDDLVKRYGIARSRLVAKGFGLTKPVAPNTTEAGKALNRRVELLRL